MPHGMSQWAWAVAVGASHLVMRDMGLLLGMEAGARPSSLWVSRSVRAATGAVKRCTRPQAPRKGSTWLPGRLVQCPNADPEPVEHQLVAQRGMGCDDGFAMA